MVIHPAPGHPKDTFVNALLHHCQNLRESSEAIRPGIVHRLDKDTSGLLIAAKDAQTHEALVGQFQKRLIEKLYLAVCIGRPKEMIIDAPIGRDRANRQKMAINPLKGKQAITSCRSLYSEKGLSLVELQPKTGRTHQLRVHMAHIGTPILGDPLYGFQATNSKFHLFSQQLHAASLRFVHPRTHQPLSFTSPAPFLHEGSYRFIFLS
jgi:23S rRNA pseudouridine1911/1915/1917 synthase